jgi:SAM-dependent methyltransferase
MTEGTSTVTDFAAGLRGKLVDELCEWEPFRMAVVEDAMRTVPRHVFLPGVPLEEAYSHGSVVTHRDSAGVALSCASQPGLVGAMLEQLDARPGHRVMEIGAGTGYNAALLAYLAGPEGQVTTVEIDAEVAEGAQRNLNAAGYAGVRVICGDGEDGCPAAHSGADPVGRSGTRRRMLAQLLNRVLRVRSAAGCWSSAGAQRPARFWREADSAD